MPCVMLWDEQTTANGICFLLCLLFHVFVVFSVPNRSSGSCHRLKKTAPKSPLEEWKNRSLYTVTSRREGHILYLTEGWDVFICYCTGLSKEYALSDVVTRVSL